MSRAVVDTGHGRDALPRTVAALEAGIEQGLHPGAQLSVLVDGGTVVDLALGESRPGRQLATGDLMLWLSSTKPVAAVAVGQLWERGLVGLDDRVAEHLPQFAQGGKERITIRHLLTHTSGFRILRFGWPQASWEEIVERLCEARIEPRWTPGAKAGYHLQSSWFVLGEIVRRLDGRPFESYVREEIFEPCGMADCWIGMPAERYRSYGDRLTPVWDTAASPPRHHGWDDEPHVTRCSPGGNGYGPVRELARFYEALRRGGETASGRRLLTAQTIEALVARHRVGMLDHTFRHVMDWSLGFIPNSAYAGNGGLPYHYGHHASPRTYGHSGYRSSTAFCDPEHALVVALAVNGTPGEEAHRRRFRAVCEAIYEDLRL